MAKGWLVRTERAARAPLNRASMSYILTAQWRSIKSVTRDAWMRMHGWDG